MLLSLQRAISPINSKLTFGPYKAQTGLLRGNETLPVDNTATAGFITEIVAPYGYKNCNALGKYTLRLSQILDN